MGRNRKGYVQWSAANQYPHTAERQRSRGRERVEKKKKAKVFC